MIHHQPTKYHHANPLTHFLNLHTSHATAAAAAALALATDSLGHGHAHHVHQQAGSGVMGDHQQHLHTTVNASIPHQPFQSSYHQHRHTEGAQTSPSRAGQCAASSQGCQTEDEEEQDESSNDKSFVGELGAHELKNEAFDSTGEMCQADGGSESENNIDIDVDDPEPRDSVDHASQCVGNERDAMESAKALVTVKRARSGSDQEHNEDEEIVIDGKSTRKESQDMEPTERASPCNESTTAVLDTDSFKTAMSSSAASLKSKRVRTIFTPEQLERLEAEFERQQYMVGPERLYLAHTLQLTEAQVRNSTPGVPE
uniref:Homeobox domain-containing protein n=1 Tax=Anopheles culicifacies TaxID=139723 RepID=A0A182ME44_9DIPT